MQQTAHTSTSTFRIGGELEVSRLGFGGLHLTGRREWGFPADRAGAVDLLRQLPRLGVNFIDTADSYGPDASEILIREALHPYRGIVVATKAGLVRPSPDQWVADGRPEHLIEQAKRSLLKLGVERIDLWQLHRVDPAVPEEEQFAAVQWLLRQGFIRHAGLSEVSVPQIARAQRWFPVATVQNLYNLAERRSEAIVRYCEEQNIGFIPWHPLASGGLAQRGTVLETLALRKNATPGHIALAWLLQRSPVILPIPGSTSISHVQQNIAAADIVFDAEEMAALNGLVR